MKVCKKCNIEKPLTEFHKNRSIKDGYALYCKTCSINKHKTYYQNNKEVIKQKTNIYYQNNKETILEKSKTKPSYHKSNPNYYQNYRKKNKNKLNEYFVEWRKNNKSAYSLRIQIWWWVKKRGVEKTAKTEELLGYSFKQFEEKIGLPLPNQQLDHKIPLSWFINETPINILFSLENLQYIDESINRTKSNSYCDNVSNEYKQLVFKYIKEKYKNRL
jgi:hypothetical protein